MRKPIVAGNWKMNKTEDEAVQLTEDIKVMLKEGINADVILCPPFTALSAVSHSLRNTRIGLGAQNMYWEEKGAYTGEISPQFLVNLNCNYVIIGHSERRKYFGETNETINKKVRAALKFNLIPIVCVGETIEEREKGVTEKVVETHVKMALKDIDEKSCRRVVIAYEPVWAIGTGKTATPQLAEDVHRFIRTLLSELYSKDTAEVVRIQYGGSVKPENARDLMEMDDIDGSLVGGASLDTSSFVKIIQESIL